MSNDEMGSSTARNVAYMLDQRHNKLTQLHQEMGISVDPTGAYKAKTILMQNHEFIALGSTSQQVENITVMAVKTAQILVGTYALGGPNFMTPEAVSRIHTCPDEHYRQAVIASVQGH